MKIAYLWTACLAFLGKTNGQCLTPNDKSDPHLGARNNLYTGQQEFSLNLLQAVDQLNPQENLFFSPYSTYHALLLAYFISSSQTESYLKKTLHLDPALGKADIFNAYKLDKFATQFRATNASYEFTNANRIYVDATTKVRDCIPAIFKEELQTADFSSKPEDARISINSWVENQTHDMIKDLLPPGAIDQTTNLVLVNAAYFKGIWENKFNPENTKKEIFYISPSKQTFVDMMQVEGAFNHDISEALDAHILELPYQGEDISMYILLPPFVKEDGVATTLRKLTLERFRAMVDENSSLVTRTVKVSLPKFTLEHTIEMTPILESLGVGNLFKADADFSLLSDTRKLSVDAGIHKAKIEIDEHGSKAAAATAIFSFRMMGDEQDNAIFNCNKPFVFLLYNKQTHTILFIGVFRKPK